MESKIFQKKRYIFIIFIVLSLLSLVYTHIGREVAYNGDDIGFHLSRINGIALGMENGDFFPKINFFFLEGMGYASPIFYSDLFLYVAGFIRFLGAANFTTYIILLFLVNLATFVIAFFSFWYYKKQIFPAVVFSILYGLASYRLSDLTERAALGELLALAFLPLALLGIWTIVHGDEKKFYLLAVGMTALIHSHVLTSFIFCIFIFVYLLVNVKTLIKDKIRIVSLIKAVILSALLSLSFLLPIIEQVMDQTFNFQVHFVTTLVENAEPISSYFLRAIRNSSSNNIGIIVFILFVFLGVKFNKLSKNSKVFLLFSVIFFILATNLVPYGLLENTPLRSIQFPWRFFSMVTVLIYWVFADNLDNFFENIKWGKVFVYSSLCFSFVLLLAHNFYPMKEERWVPRGDLEYIMSSYLGMGTEYLPAGIRLEDYENMIHDEDIVFSNANFGYNKVSVDYAINESDIPKKVYFQRVYYKGYQAKVGSEKLEVTNSEEYPGFCEVSVKGSGTLVLEYKWTVIQVVSSIVSGLSWIALAGFLIRNYAGTRNKEENSKHNNEKQPDNEER